MICYLDLFNYFDDGREIFVKVLFIEFIEFNIFRLLSVLLSDYTPFWTLNIGS